MLSQRVIAHPLLPLRIPVDRTRGGAYTSVLLAMMGMFGLFLFLTYYLQLVKGFSPVMSGLAFLPMVACIVLMSNMSSLYLLPRFGPRRLIPVGMALGCLGMVGLSQLEPDSSYAAHVLPFIMLIGLGHGLGGGAFDQRRDQGSEPGRRRCRRSPGQHQPAGRRIDRHRGAQHHRRLGQRRVFTARRWLRPPTATRPRSPVAAVIFAVGAVLAFLVLPSERRAAEALAFEVADNEPIPVAAD